MKRTTSKGLILNQQKSRERCHKCGKTCDFIIVVKPYTYHLPLLAFAILAAARHLHADEPPGKSKAGIVDSVLSWFSGEKPDSTQNSNAWVEILAALETAKTKGEDVLSSSAARAKQGKIFPVEHNAVVTAYSERRLAINGLIERMKAHLITSSADGPALLALMRTDLARITKDDTTFVQTRGTKNPLLFGLVPTVVGSAIEGCISGAVESWLTMKVEQKRLLLEQLEAKKWKAAPPISD